jgi:glycosyltransferase involved in cell wall biosynthesis
MLGTVPFHDFQTALDNSDVLIHPSFRDGGSFAVMEAMTRGLPIICLDTSGPADMVTETCGIKVALGDAAQIAEGIADALWRLAESPQLRFDMGRAAQERVESSYRWTVRGGGWCEIYHHVLAGPQRGQEVRETDALERQ